MAIVNKNQKIGSVMVIGAGVAGIQASLDMANSGYYVHLVDKSGSIGGIMAQLDKTFPTNDCAMCVISPFLVEVGRHLNINIITYSDLESLEGEIGAFVATLKSNPRYIDVKKCTGCGQCKLACPVTAVNEFNCGLDLRKAAYMSYPQAVPLAYGIDREKCIGCGMCEKACLAEAVCYSDQPKKIKLDVGAVILASGGELFNPSDMDTYNFTHPNVVTSLEFERILSASGPFKGHLMRPYDREIPQKIAWFQCVGSRDINRSPHSYCSSVCCMYSIKQSIIAKEHSKNHLDTTIFYMDMRTYGKDFDKYYVRAKEENGVRFIRSRIHTVEPFNDGDLKVRYILEDGKALEETFNMIVLATGFTPPKEMVNLSKKLGIELNAHNFVATNDFKPISTSRDGVFVCGISQSPKDIPQSVMEASAASSEATNNLSEVRWTKTRIKNLPPEIEVKEQSPRIGVFVCNCGINIGGVADVPAVRDYASTLPNVVHVEDNLFTCSQDTQEKMKTVIKDEKINRVVVASCSIRTHEPLFQETIREAGLNQYLFEMANIRDQNTWVHRNEPDKATEKAKDLVRMAVAKANYVQPLYQVALPVKQAVLVIGGGAAGMEAALGVALQGFHAHLIEKTDKLGGVANDLRFTWQGGNISKYLKDMIEKVKNHNKIKIYYEAEPVEVTGTIGSFSTTIKYRENKTADSTVIEHGAAIIATGGYEYKPDKYLYGKHPDVVTHLDLDKMFLKGDEKIKNCKVAVFVQCVGSRDKTRPYCSRVCCTHSLKSAIELKKTNQDMKVFILYRDIRTYGFRESIYQKALSKGIIFIRYDNDHHPQIDISDQNTLTIQVKDHILQMPVKLNPDLVILASAIIPNENRKLFELFKVPVNSDGFLVEAHAKLRPVDFASEGLFLAGLAHCPKSLDESIAQAKAAVSRVITVISKKEIYVGGVVASVDSDKCAVCLTCVRACPYAIPQIGEKGHAEIDSAKCHGCGVCVAECPGKAITLQHFTDKQINAKIDALFLAS